ncbi:MAG: peptide chain release factor N(5)-glutamine methyltransferase [Actinomycetota bacterium]|nr:peptide chain release factor N(5)-glutamine methyltransferase [Actinomycetota bacterium]
MRTGATGARWGVRDAVRDATAELENAGVPEPAASAEVLLAELLGIGRAEVFVGRTHLSEEQHAVYGTWISRRKQREPVQRILGRAYFRQLELELNEETLIPRPDTESVVEAAREVIDRRAGRCRVLDLGTGSGAIAISIAQERPYCEVHATDSSEKALEAARQNAEAARAELFFYRADLFSDLKDLGEKVSLLVSNPPYVRSADLQYLAPEVRDWDPHSALDGGPDGLSFYRRIFAEAGPLLENGADVVLEVGNGQAEAVSELGREAGFVPLGTRDDLTGTPRAVLSRWTG